MKNREKSKKRRVENFPVWTHEQAVRAVPYINSVMKSIRDIFLKIRSHRLRIKYLDEKPGRPARKQLIERQEAVAEMNRLDEQLARDLEELGRLNIHCIEPACGIAMIPFVNTDQLAWFIFDLFEPTHIVSWRYHHDPLTMRRPLSEMDEKPAAVSVIV